MLRVKKTDFVEKLSNIFAQNTSFIIFSYKSFKVSSMTQLKLKLKQEKANLTILKNSLAKIASNNAFNQDISVKLNTLFKGQPLGIVYGEVGFCAKTLKKFMSDAPDILKVLGGLVDGEIFDEKEFDKLTSLPSRQELITKLNSLIAAPVVALQKTVTTPAVALMRVKNAIDQIQKQ